MDEVMKRLLMLLIFLPCAMYGQLLFGVYGGPNGGGGTTQDSVKKVRTGTAGSETVTNTLSVSVDITDGDYAILELGYTNTTATATATYDGSSITDEIMYRKSVDNEVIYAWGTTISGTGSKTFSITWSNATAGRIGVYILKNVNQTTPHGTAATAEGSYSNNPSIVLSCPARSMIVDLLTSEYAASSRAPGANQTENWDDANTINSTYVSSSDTYSSNPSWTLSDVPVWCYGGFVVNHK